MGIFPVLLFSGVFLGLAYWIYGRILARWFRLDPNVETPATEFRDDVDYVPIEPQFLMGQHFSAIAAAGPIVGPILAGVMFGWLPALIWILIGSIFIGGVHDFSALVASIRHRANSITEVVREYMTKRSYILFLIFVWIALVYVIVAFTDIVAGSFVGVQELEDGTVVSGGGIATSSLLYLALPIIMGVLLRFTKMPLWLATVIFLPLVGLSIWGGQYIPLDLAAILNVPNHQAQKIWDVILLVYCFIASIVPMWLLLQPRGHLGGYFLYIALLGGLIGVVLGGKEIQYPAFTGWVWESPKGEMLTLFPMLFITIACGACSGFHSLVATGTTSKQLRKETDAKVIGYGAMLLEGMVAAVSLSCVMILSYSAANALAGKPNFIYAQGLGQFLEVLYIPAAFGISFGLMAFTTFVYDTLDVCTRLTRYIVQELTGWTGTQGRYFATFIATAVPLFFVLQDSRDALGNPIPVWRTYWSLFGASNQLLAALTLMAVTVWLYQTYRARWVWFAIGLPTLWMYVMSIWSLLIYVKGGFFTSDWQYKGVTADPIPWVGILLILLAVILFTEAITILRKLAAPEPPDLEPEPAIG